MPPTTLTPDLHHTSTFHSLISPVLRVTWISTSLSTSSSPLSVLAAAAVAVPTASLAARVAAAMPLPTR